jgi:hypothetical protein
MAFVFNTNITASTEAPYEERQVAPLYWSDNAVTIDTWLVEVYPLNMNGSLGVVPIAQAYVNVLNSSANAGRIDMNEWVQSFTIETFAPYQKGGGGVQPAAEDINYMFGALDGFQFQIYSVTGGTKSAVQGTYNYIPVRMGKRENWAWNDWDFSDYFPDAATKKGWMTEREVSSSLGVNYYFADEDQAIASLLQMQNADYVYNGINNLNESDWVKVSYTLYFEGVVVDFFDLSLGTAPTTWSYAQRSVPIGPANIKDNPNWTLVYDWDDGWDYYEVQARDSSNLPLGRPIRVYKDCRPIKHAPAQLYWIGARGGAEFLRFDGRVKDVYDVSGRDTYKINRNLETQLSYSTQGFQSYLPQYISMPSVGKRSFVLSEDFFTDAERELFKSAVTAQYMMVRFGGQWYPCRMKTTSYTHEQASSRLLPITCEVEVTMDLLC